MQRRYTFIIYGKVQGVLYRDFTRRTANKLGLVGYVENLDDGTVKVEVEGDEELLKIFEMRLREGSRFSKVESVSVIICDALIGSKDFKIKYKNFLDRF